MAIDGQAHRVPVAFRSPPTLMAFSSQGGRIIAKQGICGDADDVFVDSRRQRTRSALVGANWQVQENIAVDFGLRGVRINDHTAGEIRVGVTFAFGVTKGSDIVSALFALALRRNH